MKWSLKEPFGLGFLWCLVWVGQLVWGGFLSIHLFFFWPVISLTGQHIIFNFSWLLVDVPAPVQVCVGVDVCEADEPWPHGCPVLTVTSCALGAAPVPTQPVLPCCCLSSHTCLLQCLACHTISVQALPIKQTDCLPAHSKSAYAGVKFTEGL